jgi:pimeloyl-ACP methyl ester carboxylesterase
MKAHLDFRGERIAYQVRGKGRAMVLIHGFLASSELWEKVVPRLAKKFKVITIDLPGHGDSSAMGYVHNMELLAEAVKSILDELNLRKVVMVGHSLGGYVAMAFAEAFPDKLLGLVMINSTAKGDSDQRKASRNQLIDLLKNNKDKALRMLVPTFFSVKSRTTHWHEKKYLQWARSCSLQGVIATIEGMKRRKEREIILKFAPFPYVYLIGEKDEILMKDELSQEAQLGEEGAFIMLNKSGHMAVMEEPERVFKYLRQFGKNLTV